MADGVIMFGYANPRKYKSLSKIMICIFAVLAAILIPWGLYIGLISSPADYQQSETVRIMYVHVPSAWVALFCYSSLAVAGFIFLIWKHVLAGLYIRSACHVGAAFTAICLVTGSLWGTKMWGTWWVWDARLTSMLILFFLYLGIIALKDAFDNKDKGITAISWLAIIGSVNLPIIKYSVEWWNTLHQPASITSFKKMIDPAISSDFLAPLMLMSGGMISIFAIIVILRLNNEIRERKIITRRLRDE